MARYEYWEEALKVAEEFYKKDVNALASMIHEAMKRQRTEMAFKAETLWNVDTKSEDYNKACLDIVGLIRNGDPDEINVVRRLAPFK